MTSFVAAHPAASDDAKGVAAWYVVSGQASATARSAGGAHAGSAAAAAASASSSSSSAAPAGGLEIPVHRVMVVPAEEVEGA